MRSLIMISLLIGSIITFHQHEVDEQRERDRLDSEQGNLDMTEGHYERRRAQSTSWRHLRIYFDNSSLYEKTPSKRAFYQKTFDIVGEWWSQALWVRDDPNRTASEITRYGNYRSEYRYSLPSGKSLTDYDLFVKVSWGNDSGTVLAYAGPRIRHPVSQRPISGITCITPFGDTNFQRSDDSINRAVGTIIHEFGHVIAFISFDQIQRRYVEINRTLNAYVWKGPKVLAAANRFYGCSSNSITGVPLQNNEGRVGGHWDESYLNDELMTPTTGASPEKVSVMTLALCEDTDWYKAEYSFTENFTYGKGNGCGFSKACPSPAICTNGTSGFVTSDYRGVGYCWQNSNGCAKENKYSNRDCDKGSGWGSNYDQFGAAYGTDAAIAQGRFVRSLGRSYTYNSKICAKVSCSSGYSSYTYTFKNFKLSGSSHSGDVTVWCNSVGNKNFNEGTSLPASYVECISPRKFCEGRFGTGTAGKACHSTCRKNGRCQVSNGNPRCWCYSNYQLSSSSCPALSED